MADKTKQELVAEAEAAGIDVKSRDTKAEIEAKLAEQETVEAPPPAAVAAALDAGVVPVRVDNLSRRSDDDALEGQFVRVVGGDHQGVVGSFDHVLAYGKDGYPSKIAVISRDARNELLEVDYADARPTAGEYAGGR